MKKIYLLILFLLVVGFANAVRNVVLIIADDIGTDYFGFYEDHADTANLPNLRALAQRGIRFRNVMSNPVCSATRAGILTGRYSFRTGVGYIVGSGQGSGELDTNELTLPKVLHQMRPEIKCAQIGKWHLNSPNPATNLLYPNIDGFDHFEGPFIGAIPDYYNWTKYTNGIASQVTTYATTEGVNNAIAAIDAFSSSPFFLWLAFNAPHSPYHLPPSGTYSDTTLTGTQASISANPKLYFKASLESMDYEIGRLFDSLRVRNLLDSTDIIFIGDNGNTTQTAQIANRFRAKGTVYQYGVHEPGIIAGPSVINPGRASDALVNTADLFATIIELMTDSTWTSYISPNSPVDSKSVLPVILDQQSQIRPWTFTEVFKNIPDSNDAKAIRNSDYKLIAFDNGVNEFYKLSNDSLERFNLLNLSMSSIDSSNYIYLCNEMSILVGSGNFCSSSVGISDNDQSEKVSVYPNPFYSNLTIKADKIDRIILWSYSGEMIYSGPGISEQDFSSLPAGMYFVAVRSGNEEFFRKLIHY